MCKRAHSVVLRPSCIKWLRESSERCVSVHVYLCVRWAVDGGLKRRWTLSTFLSGLHLLCFGVELFLMPFDLPFYPRMDPSIHTDCCVWGSVFVCAHAHAQAQALEATVGGLLRALRLAVIDEASVSWTQDRDGKRSRQIWECRPYCRIHAHTHPDSKFCSQILIINCN